MWLHPIRLPYRGPRHYNLHFSADWQLGSSSAVVDRVEDWVHTVASDKNGVWAILGDIEDDDRPTTRTRKRQTFADRQGVMTNAGRDHCAWLDQKIVPLMAPLSRRPSMGILAGHHWSELSAGFNSVQYLCRKLNEQNKHKTKYLGEMASFIRFDIIGEGKYKGQNFRRWYMLQHGTGGGVLGSSLKKLDKHAGSFVADGFVRAHSCDLESSKKPVLYPEIDEHGVSRLRRKTIVLLNVSCATESFEISRKAPWYPEAAMWTPKPMGWGTIRLDMRPPKKWEHATTHLVPDFSITI